jgi:hypothetical protein
MGDGDRLFVYFTGHGGPGGRQTPRNTTLDLWLDGGMTVRELVALLDKLSPKVRVVLVMVQCHAGGFGDVIFRNADVGPVLAEPTRCGFFATWPDRLAAGCTPDTQEENYKDYSTSFFAALSGHTRTGEKVERPDYDGDGRTSLAEAHAYVLLNSDTIDIPMTTSDVLLRQFGKTKDERAADLVTPSTSFEALLARATPDRRTVLQGLSDQLKLTGDDRAASAKALADVLDKRRKALEPPQQPRGGGNRRGGGRDRDPTGERIRARLLARWPEMASPFHPAVAAALAREPDEIVRVIELTPGFQKWEDANTKANERADQSFELERKWVKCQRFLYVAETVALEANLPKFAGKLVQARYAELRAAENGFLGEGK